MKMTAEYSEEEENEIRDRVYELYKDFSKSELFYSLSEIQREQAEDVIMMFADYMSGDHCFVKLRQETVGRQSQR